MFCIIQSARMALNPNKPTHKRNCYYVYCNQYHRYKWVEKTKFLKNPPKNGRQFPWRSLKECSDFEDFIRQFPIQKKLSGGIYPQIGLNGRHLLIHKFIVESIIGHELEKDFSIDHIDNNPLNYSLENLEVVFHWENVERSSKYKEGCFKHSQNNSYAATFKGEYLGWYKTREEALRARQEAINNFLDENKELCNKKMLYNLKIQDFVRAQKQKIYSMKELNIS